MTIGTEKPYPCKCCQKRFTTNDGVQQHMRDAHGVTIHKKAKEPLTCGYCGTPAKRVDSKVIYKTRSYGPAWICGNYPRCDAYVGCHPGTNKPLGRLANGELREWKMAAHKAFDPLWKELGMGRKDAYKWLALELEIKHKECHIGSFTIEQCRLTIEACNEKRHELRTVLA
jgi:hypothetical protein